MLRGAVVGTDVLLVAPAWALAFEPEKCNGEVRSSGPDVDSRGAVAGAVGSGEDIGFAVGGSETAVPGGVAWCRERESAEACEGARWWRAAFIVGKSIERALKAVAAPLTSFTRPPPLNDRPGNCSDPKAPHFYEEKCYQGVDLGLPSVLMHGCSP